MNALLRRRGMMQSKEREDVRFWVSSEDEPVTIDDAGGIVERTQQAFFYTTETSIYDYAEKIYDFRSNSQYCQRNDTAIYDFGHHWKLYFDIDAYVYNSRTTNRYFLDFGSVAVSPHAFGFHMALATGSRTTVGINWKLNGNSSNPGIATLSHSYVPTVSYQQYERVKGYYAIVDGGDGFDRLEVSINGVTERYDVKIPQVSYSPPWSNYKFIIGGAVNNTFSLPNYMRELKLVVID